VQQLAAQGMLADTQLAFGERTLILQIGEVERYAGSLILLARNNPRGLPALEEQEIVSPQLTFPGIQDQGRLSRPDELIVLECVVQLLVEHGICLRHEGLLVFPALFRPTEVHSENSLPYAISLYYDFSGAIDNIYSSLVVALSYSRKFGRLRLWEDRAEFESGEAGACGLRKVERRSGFAHLDVYFEIPTPQTTRDLFLSFVDEHLRQHGVEIYERLEITCTCDFIFDEETVRLRIAQSKADIVCPRCERRTLISEGAQVARERDPELARKTWALRTEVEKRTRKEAKEAKRIFIAKAVSCNVGRLRVLHLSDLHFTEETDPEALLQPLTADLRDKEGGLDFERLDYLVITGDFTKHASATEFERARQFISGAIREFELTAARCLIVPGNHDLDWDEQVYEWQPKRSVDVAELRPGTYRQQGEGLLVRDDERYHNRFRGFSEHFYHPLIQQPYPLEFEEQCLVFLFADTGVQFLTLNSAWEVDEYFPRRSGIHPGALSRGLVQAEDQVARARKEGQLVANKPLLRIALWHHPVMGAGHMEEDAFLERLRQTGFRLCLHGHVHEDRADLVGYLHPTRKVYIAGAGAFGAAVHDRPESVPRLYNVLDIAPDRDRICVHTRCLRKETGAWEGWAVWPGDTPTERRTYYEINLSS